MLGSNKSNDACFTVEQVQEAQQSSAPEESELGVGSVVMRGGMATHLLTHRSSRFQFQSLLKKFEPFSFSRTAHLKDAPRAPSISPINRLSFRFEAATTHDVP